MQSQLTLKPHLSVGEIKERMYGSNNGHHASYWQIILTVSLNPGLSTKQYCTYLGISDTKFHRIVSLYNQYGASFCKALKWGGRREARCTISFEQEAQVLETCTATALEGGVLVAR